MGIEQRTSVFERELNETKEEAELKWSRAADEIKDSLAAAQVRDDEIRSKEQAQRELESEVRNLRKKAAKASHASAEGVAVGGHDWSRRRLRLNEWKATLMRSSIPLSVFESRPATGA